MPQEASLVGAAVLVLLDSAYAPPPRRHLERGKRMVSAWICDVNEIVQHDVMQHNPGMALRQVACDAGRQRASVSL